MKYRMQNPIASYTPGDAWRECPRCHGVKILAGAPVLKAGAELVEFHLVRNRGRAVGDDGVFSVRL